ncbi:hypothetical protein E1258_29365 [Micromonospora sp. KC207]|uniref:hypothetical protein n=1 Tax=Micromonospora sp. KC207 TaxID=2530377 RepID=UPI00104B5270|nr:hypothetical protein [Micromonospora sp. KC207]TDC46568.1 hypothetical protein E1258_29365 [Micromonospora sp. KC207]
MSQPPGHIWVDPEGVISVGDSYAQHAARYHECLRRLNVLRARYEPAWGDDEIGRQFQEQFGHTLDRVESAIRAVLGYLEYAAVGLRVSGEGYRQADEDATIGGRTIAEEFANLPVRLAGYAPWKPVDGEPGQLTSRLAVTGKLPRSEEVASRQALPRSGVPVLRAGVRIAGPVTAPESVESPSSFLASRRPAEFAVASPAISAFRRYDTRGVLIDGTPVPPGYELRTLTTFPDGTARIDANGYDSIVPLGTRVPITAAGHPVDGDGDQFFLLKPKEDAGVDPTAPGYRPLLISFGPDGSATPLFTGPA